MKHFIEALKKTLSADDRVEIKTTIDQYEEQMKKSVVPIQTPSPALNYALNIKREEAYQRGIEFISKVNLFHSFDMEDSDLFLLVSNLLDNAIQHIGMKKEFTWKFRT